jgi:hypothetical protein
LLLTSQDCTIPDGSLLAQSDVADHLLQHVHIAGRQQTPNTLSALVAWLWPQHMLLHLLLQTSCRWPWHPCTQLLATATSTAAPPLLIQWVLPLLLLLQNCCWHLLLLMLRRQLLRLVLLVALQLLAVAVCLTLALGATNVCFPLRGATMSILGESRSRGLKGT